MSKWEINLPESQLFCAIRLFSFQGTCRHPFFIDLFIHSISPIAVVKFIDILETDPLFGCNPLCYFERPDLYLVCLLKPKWHHK